VRGLLSGWQAGRTKEPSLRKSIWQEINTVEAEVGPGASESRIIRKNDEKPACSEEDFFSTAYRRVALRELRRQAAFTHKMIKRSFSSL